MHTTNLLAVRGFVAVAAFGLVLGLSACGGVDTAEEKRLATLAFVGQIATTAHSAQQSIVQLAGAPQDPLVNQRRFAHGGSAATAVVGAGTTASALSATELLNWLQVVLPSLFTPGAADQVVVAAGISYTLRAYPATGSYLAVANTDGTVYALGAFTNQQILSFGKLADYTCDVRPACAWLTPDADGNVSAGIAKATELSVRAGDVMMFRSLSPQDAIIEVNSRGLTGAQLCSDNNLPAGTAHPVVAQAPLPSSHYAANELSGPYRAYPAGSYALSVGSDACGYVEKTSACLSPNEQLSATQVNAAGKTENLCSISPLLMSVADPTKPANNPPRENPACVRGKVLDTTWSDPAVQGVFLRLDWKDLNTAYGVYNWTALDRELVSAVRHGKTVTVGVRVGGNSIPDWAFDTGDVSLGAIKKVVLKDWGSGGDALPNGNCGFDYAVASPSDLAFRKLFKKMIADMGSHMRDDQRRFSVLAGVKITGMGMATLENRLPSRCNIAVKNTALGDTGTQGHIISMSTTSLANPVFDPKYSLSTDPSVARIKDVSQCVCNAQVLQFAGYRPSTLQAFYAEVEATIHENFGYKQKIFMNISDGFPQIGEGGRFLGDHLKPPILTSTLQAGQTVLTYGALFGSPARSPIDIPGGSDTTAAIVADARAGVFAGGDATAGRSIGLENAALDVAGFSKQPNQGIRCNQQVGITLTGDFAGSAAFPIAAGTRIDATGAGCPNQMATTEGVSYDKVTGFQVVNTLVDSNDMDSALWNMTLNTNALFFEPYETDAWRARKQSALNPGGVFSISPSVKTETATSNYASATAKSGATWNNLLLARAKAFSADPNRNNLYQVNPFASEYSVPIVSASASTRYFFNSRACNAYIANGTPVRINAISVLN